MLEPRQARRKAGKGVGKQGGREAGRHQASRKGFRQASQATGGGRAGGQAGGQAGGGRADVHMKGYLHEARRQRLLLFCAVLAPDGHEDAKELVCVDHKHLIRRAFLLLLGAKPVDACGGRTPSLCWQGRAIALGGLVAAGDGWR
eukprot:1331877-Pleurochrysis_carterae.AAC.1